jgi:hypothetical protein
VWSGPIALSVAINVCISYDNRTSVFENVFQKMPFNFVCIQIAVPNLDLHEIFLVIFMSAYITKFLYSDIQSFRNHDNLSLEESSPKIGSFAVLLEKGFISKTGIPWGHVERDLEMYINSLTVFPDPLSPTLTSSAMKTP